MKGWGEAAFEFEIAPHTYMYAWVFESDASFWIFWIQHWSTDPWIDYRFVAKF